MAAEAETVEIQEPISVQKRVEESQNHTSEMSDRAISEVLPADLKDIPSQPPKADEYLPKPEDKQISIDAGAEMLNSGSKGNPESSEGENILISPEVDTVSSKEIGEISETCEVDDNLLPKGEKIVENKPESGVTIEYQPGTKEERVLDQHAEVGAAKVVPLEEGPEPIAPVETLGDNKENSAFDSIKDRSTSDVAASLPMKSVEAKPEVTEGTKEEPDNPSLDESGINETAPAVEKMLDQASSITSKDEDAADDSSEKMKYLDEDNKQGNAIDQRTVDTSPPLEVNTSMCIIDEKVESFQVKSLETPLLGGDKICKGEDAEEMNNITEEMHDRLETTKEIINDEDMPKPAEEGRSESYIDDENKVDITKRENDTECVTKDERNEDLIPESAVPEQNFQVDQKDADENGGNLEKFESAAGESIEGETSQPSENTWDVFNTLMMRAMGHEDNLQTEDKSAVIIVTFPEEKGNEATLAEVSSNSAEQGQVEGQAQKEISSTEEDLKILQESEPGEKAEHSLQLISEETDSSPPEANTVRSLTEVVQNPAETEDETDNNGIEENGSTEENLKLDAETSDARESKESIIYEHETKTSEIEVESFTTASKLDSEVVPEHEDTEQVIINDKSQIKDGSPEPVIDESHEKMPEVEVHEQPETTITSEDAETRMSEEEMCEQQPTLIKEKVKEGCKEEYAEQIITEKEVHDGSDTTSTIEVTEKATEDNAVPKLAEEGSTESFKDDEEKAEKEENDTKCVIEDGQKADLRPGSAEEVPDQDVQVDREYADVHDEEKLEKSEPEVGKSIEDETTQTSDSTQEKLETSQMIHEDNLQIEEKGVNKIEALPEDEGNENSVATPAEVSRDNIEQGETEGQGEQEIPKNEEDSKTLEESEPREKVEHSSQLTSEDTDTIPLEADRIQFPTEVAQRPGEALSDEKQVTGAKENTSTENTGSTKEDLKLDTETSDASKSKESINCEQETEVNESEVETFTKADKLELEEDEEISQGVKIEDKEEDTKQGDINDESHIGDGSPESSGEVPHESTQEVQEEHLATDTSEDAEKHMVEEEEIHKHQPIALTDNLEEDSIEENAQIITETEVHDEPEITIPTEVSNEIIKDIDVSKREREERLEGFTDEEKKAETKQDGDKECVAEDGQTVDHRPESAEEVTDRNFQVDEKDADKHEDVEDIQEKSDSTAEESNTSETGQTSENLQIGDKSTNTIEAWAEEKGNEEKTFTTSAEASSEGIEQGEIGGQAEKETLKNEDESKISEPGEEVEHSSQETPEENDEVALEVDTKQGDINDESHIGNGSPESSGEVSHESPQEVETPEEIPEIEVHEKHLTANTLEDAEKDVVEEEEIHKHQPTLLADKVDEDSKEENEQIITEKEVHDEAKTTFPAEVSSEVIKDDDISKREDEARQEDDTECVTEVGQNEDHKPESAEEVTERNIQVDERDANKHDAEKLEKSESTAGESNTSETGQTTEDLQIEDKDIDTIEALTEEKGSEDKSFTTLAEASSDDNEQNQIGGQAEKETLKTEDDSKISEPEEKVEHSSQLTPEEPDEIAPEADINPCLIEGAIKNREEALGDEEEVSEAADNNNIEENGSTKEETEEMDQGSKIEGEEDTKQGDINDESHIEEGSPESSGEVSHENPQEEKTVAEMPEIEVHEEHLVTNTIKDAEKEVEEGEIHKHQPTVLEDKVEEDSKENGQIITEKEVHDDAETTFPTEVSSEVLKDNDISKQEEEERQEDVTECVTKDGQNEDQPESAEEVTERNLQVEGKDADKHDAEKLEKSESTTGESNTSETFQTSEELQTEDKSIDTIEALTEEKDNEDKSSTTLAKASSDDNEQSAIGGQAEKETLENEDDSMISEPVEKVEQSSQLTPEETDKVAPEAEMNPCLIEGVVKNTEEAPEDEEEVSKEAENNSVEENGSTKKEEAEEVDQGAKIEGEEDTKQGDINDDSQIGEGSPESSGEVSNENPQEEKTVAEMPEIEVHEEHLAANTLEDAEKDVVEEEEIHKHQPTLLADKVEEDSKEENEQTIAEKEVHDEAETTSPTEVSSEVIKDNDISKQEEEERQKNDTECVAEDGQNKDHGPETAEEVTDRNFQVDEKDADKHDAEKLEKSESTAGESNTSETGQTSEDLQIEDKSIDTIEALTEEKDNEEKSLTSLAEACSDDIEQSDIGEQAQTETLQNEDDSKISEPEEKVEQPSQLTPEETDEVTPEANINPCLIEGGVKNPEEALNDEEKVTEAENNNSIKKNGSTKKEEADEMDPEPKIEDKEEDTKQAIINEIPNIGDGSPESIEEESHESHQEVKTEEVPEVEVHEQHETQNEKPDLSLSTKDENVKEISEEDESSPTNLQEASNPSLELERDTEEIGSVEETMLQDRREPENDQHTLNNTEEETEETLPEEIEEGLVDNSSFKSEVSENSEELQVKERTVIIDSDSQSPAIAIEETEVREAEPEESTGVGGSVVPLEEEGLATIETKGDDLDSMDINAKCEDPEQVAKVDTPSEETLKGLKENSEVQLEEQSCTSTQAREANETSEETQDPLEVSETQSSSLVDEEELIKKEISPSNTIVSPVEAEDMGEKIVDEAREEQGLHTEQSDETYASNAEDAEVSEVDREEDEREKPIAEAVKHFEPSGIREDDEKDIEEPENFSTESVGSLKDDTGKEKEANEAEKSNITLQPNDEVSQLEENPKQEESDHKPELEEDQSSEAILDTNKSQKEEETISAQIHEAENENEEEIETELKTEDATGEEQNVNEIIKSAILSQEVDEEENKGDDSENIKEDVKEKDYIGNSSSGASIEDKTINEEKDDSPTSVECIEAKDSNEQMKAESSEVKKDSSSGGEASFTVKEIIEEDDGNGDSSNPADADQEIKEVEQEKEEATSSNSASIKAADVEEHRKNEESDKSEVIERDADDLYIPGEHITEETEKEENSPTVENPDETPSIYPELTESKSSILESSQAEKVVSEEETIVCEVVAEEKSIIIVESPVDYSDALKVEGECFQGPTEPETVRGDDISADHSLTANKPDGHIETSSSVSLSQQQERQTGIVAGMIEEESTVDIDNLEDVSPKDSSDANKTAEIHLQPEEIQEQEGGEKDVSTAAHSLPIKEEIEDSMEVKPEEQNLLAVSALPSNEQQCDGETALGNAEGQTSEEKSEEEVQEKEQGAVILARTLEDSKIEAEVITEDKSARVEDSGLPNEPTQHQAAGEDEVIADQDPLEEKAEEQSPTAISAVPSNEQQCEGESAVGNPEEHGTVILAKTLEDNKTEAVAVTENVSAQVEDSGQQKEPHVPTKDEVTVDQAPAEEKAEEQNSSAEKPDQEVENADKQTSLAENPDQDVQEEKHGAAILAKKLEDDKNEEAAITEDESAQDATKAKSCIEDEEPTKPEAGVEDEITADQALVEEKSAEEVQEEKHIAVIPATESEDDKPEAVAQDEITIDQASMEEKAEEQSQITISSFSSKEQQFEEATVVENADAETFSVKISEQEVQEEAHGAVIPETKFEDEIKEEAAIKEDGSTGDAKDSKTEENLCLQEEGGDAEAILEDNITADQISTEEKAQEQVATSILPSTEQADESAPKVESTDEHTEHEAVVENKVTVDSVPEEKPEEDTQAENSEFPLKEQEVEDASRIENIEKEKIEETEISENQSQEHSVSANKADGVLLEEGMLQEIETIRQKEIISQKKEEAEIIEDAGADDLSDAKATRDICLQTESLELEEAQKNEAKVDQIVADDKSEEQTQIASSALPLEGEEHQTTIQVEEIGEDKLKEDEMHERDISEAKSTEEKCSEKEVPEILEDGVREATIADQAQQSEESRENGDSNEKINENKEVTQATHETSLEEESTKAHDQEDQKMECQGEDKNATFTIITSKIQNVKLFEETQKVEASDTVKEVLAEDRRVEEPDSTSSVITETTTVRKEESIESINDIQQIEKTANEASDKQIPREIDLTESTGTKAATGNELAPLEKQERAAEQAEVRDLAPGNAPVVYSERKSPEHGQEKRPANADGKAVEDPATMEAISLADLLHKSRKETPQIAKETTEETKSPVASQQTPQIKEVETTPVKEEKTDEEKEDEAEGNKLKKSDSDPDSPVMVEAPREVNIKNPHKKSHNILSGVSSKVKHSIISKVKKAFTCGSPLTAMSEISEKPEEYQKL